MSRSFKKKVITLLRANDIKINDFTLKQYFLSYDNITSIEKKIKESQKKIVYRFNQELIDNFPKLNSLQQIIKPFGYTFSFPDEKFYSLSIMLQNNQEDSLFFEGTETIRYEYDKGFYNKKKESVEFGIETAIKRYEELFIIKNKYSNINEKQEIEKYLQWTKPEIEILNYKK
jgi:hypothetical protein